jgi:hypothetical protein
MILISFLYEITLNFYMLLCWNNTLKQKTLQSSLAYYVQHVSFYTHNSAKHVYVLTFRSFPN